MQPDDCRGDTAAAKIDASSRRRSLYGIAFYQNE